MTDTQILADPTTQLPRYQVPAGCALVIFGASGDLTRRKLLPALSAGKEFLMTVPEITISPAPTSVTVPLASAITLPPGE